MLFKSRKYLAHIRRAVSQVIINIIGHKRRKERIDKRFIECRGCYFACPIRTLVAHHVEELFCLGKSKRFAKVPKCTCDDKPIGMCVTRYVLGPYFIYGINISQYLCRSIFIKADTDTCVITLERTDNICKALIKRTVGHAKSISC